MGDSYPEPVLRQSHSMSKYNLLILLLALLLTSEAALNDQLPVFSVDYALTNYEYQKFVEHTESRLPTYIKSFKKYSAQYKVPWTLIAAVAYQESKWNEAAESHTGVKGLMQLTSKTAEHLGVDDREDPYQSIQGGAMYLKYLYDKTPHKLHSKQRWALALAAYNIGWGHLRDAHFLALRLKKDPYNWAHLKRVLPHLENELYYSKLSFGYARGNETVVFVDKVFNYYSLMNDTFEGRSFLAKFNFDQ